MITAHIASLTKKGYIKKQQSPDDKRAFYVLPTDKALELVASAKADLNRHFEQLIKEMGQDEFDHFVRLAGKANQILKTNQKERG